MNHMRKKIFITIIIVIILILAGTIGRIIESTFPFYLSFIRTYWIFYGYFGGMAINYCFEMWGMK